MKYTNVKTVSAGALVLMVALASLPVAGKAGDRSVWSSSRATSFRCQPAVQYSINSEAVRLSLRDPVVVQVQLALRRRGYYNGEITGFMGDNTQRAIELFQVCHCCTAAPLITRWVLAALGIGSEGKTIFSGRSSGSRQSGVID
jgi:peptidoglycan hydrolase-like protein with peptidoglycan-binding domain